MSFRFPVTDPPPIEYVVRDSEKAREQTRGSIEQQAVAEPETQVVKPAPQKLRGRPAISLRGVCKDFVVGLKLKRVLAGVDFDIYPGVTLLFGPNGAGKTTVLKLLSGRLPPTRGRVEFVQGGAPAPFFAPEGARVWSTHSRCRRTCSCLHQAKRRRLGLSLLYSRE